MAAKKPDKADALERYVSEVDRFATMLRDQQQLIAKVGHEVDIAKAKYKEVEWILKDAKEVEHNIVSQLLKFIKPGSIEVMPLFDQMDKADDEIHGKDSEEWRKELVSAMGLSPAATRTLIDADIVLVGQLQDRVMKGPEWSTELSISDGMAQAIELKLQEFIAERTGKK